MKKIFAILMLFAFMVQFVPMVNTLVHADTSVAIDMEDEQSPEKKKDNDEKKEIKDLTGPATHIPIEATLKFSYIHSTHLLGDSPATDILTPPPNRV
jgi:hypothetical protein